MFGSYELWAESTLSVPLPQPQGVGVMDDQVSKVEPHDGVSDSGHARGLECGL